MARNWDPSIKLKLKTIGTSLVMSCLSSQVYAAAFQIQEQNATNLGTAYSGTAALAEDASTNFYNAAGLTRLGESQVVVSGVLINGSFKLNATGSNVSLLPGTPVPGSLTDNPGKVDYVPSLYVSKRFDDQWVFGFGVNTPFGLDTKYQENGIARYVATETSLISVDFSPSVAYEVNRCLSIGAGVDAQYGKADLNLRIGTGNIAADGFQKNHLHGWGYGFHAGILYSPWETTRIGLNYRSRVNTRAKGDSENLSANTPIFTAGADTYVIQRVNATLTLPETLTLSLYQDFNPQLAMTADLAWTNWSRFHNLSLRFTPGVQLPLITGGVTPGLDTDTLENFRDAYRFALGLIYTMDESWLFRIGAAYDETPTRDSTRTARIPDQNRIWTAIGGAYTVARDLRIDFGYAHLFFKDPVINELAPFATPVLGGTIGPGNPRISNAALSGRYRAHANIVGLQMRYDFV